MHNNNAENQIDLNSNLGTDSFLNQVHICVLVDKQNHLGSGSLISSEKIAFFHNFNWSFLALP